MARNWGDNTEFCTQFLSMTKVSAECLIVTEITQQQQQYQQKKYPSLSHTR